MQLYSSHQFFESKNQDKLPFQCDNCNGKFWRTKYQKNHTVKYKGLLHDYCGHKCNKLRHKTSKTIPCAFCGKLVLRSLHFINKNQNTFCSHKCCGIFTSSHSKRKGTQRSKLEKWLETNLRNLYPLLDMHFNQNSAINAELDIYIPSLKLAFELNGPFHYEPIFGKDKLAKIQNNDQRKFQACLERGIELCIIDTSKQKYFKENTSQQFLDIIVNIVANKWNQ